MTTFERFIENNPEQKKLFDKEYAEFLRSEQKLQEKAKKEKKAKKMNSKSKKWNQKDVQSFISDANRPYITVD